MEQFYLTITGTHAYYGLKPLAIDRIIHCIKEPENPYDAEAIRCELPYIGTVGYVANSPKTKVNGTLSAGRLYDSAPNDFYVIVKFTTTSRAIALILTEETQRAVNPDIIK